MQIRTGHGPKDWKDLGPGYAASGHIGGALLVGSDGPVSNPNVMTNSHARQRKRDACSLKGRCQHGECVAVRMDEAKRLNAKGLTMDEIGVLLGNRTRWTISYYLRDHRRVRILEHKKARRAAKAA